MGHRVAFGSCKGRSEANTSSSGHRTGSRGLQGQGATEILLIIINYSLSTPVNAKFRELTTLIINYATRIVAPQFFYTYTYFIAMNN